jgi:uncharacterized coiled-coil protein SlyX
MSNVANASINTFGNSPKVDFVPTSEQLITLTIGQLQDLVTQAVEKANQPLQDRIESLEKMVATQDAKIATLTSTQEQDVNRICLDIAYDRQRLARLEQRPAPGVTAPTAPPKGEKTISRIAKVKNFLKTRGGGATFQECERFLSILPNQMTRLVSMMDKRSFEIFPRPGDGRQRILRLKVGRSFT